MPKTSKENFFTKGCILEEGMDYRVGAGGVIKEWQSSDLTKEDCATLADSHTPRGSYWTYKASEKGCWLKNNNTGRTPDSGVVSGNRACGRASAGETSFVFSDLCEKLVFLVLSLVGYVCCK